MAKHTGGCHCSQVAYEVDVDLSNVLECNCSVCSKRGSLLAFAPEDQFTLLTKDAALTDYQFNKKIIHHLFCPTCGIMSFAKAVGPDGKKMVALNVRCLDGVDISSLTITPYNGRDL